MRTNLILSIVTAFCFLTSCKDETKKVQEKSSGLISNIHKDNELTKTIEEKMKKLPITGNFDVDFAHIMILHHQETIDIAKKEAEKGSDKKIKKMVQNMIIRQTEEQAQLKDFLKNFKLKHPKVESTHHELQIEMSEMIDKIKKIDTTGNIDKDFVLIMIPHHQCAIEMCKSLFFHSKNTALQHIAQKIITAHTTEIKELKTWFSANY